jgi:hypothetical protein
MDKHRAQTDIHPWHCGLRNKNSCSVRLTTAIITIPWQMFQASHLRSISKSVCKVTLHSTRFVLQHDTTAEQSP